MQLVATEQSLYGDWSLILGHGPQVGPYWDPKSPPYGHGACGPCNKRGGAQNLFVPPIRAR